MIQATAKCNALNGKIFQNFWSLTYIHVYGHVKKTSKRAKRTNSSP